MFIELIKRNSPNICPQQLPLKGVKDMSNNQEYINKRLQKLTAMLDEAVEEVKAEEEVKESISDCFKPLINAFAELFEALDVDSSTFSYEPVSTESDEEFVITRLTEEYNDLQEKAGRLNDFVESPPVALDKYYEKLCVLQITAMGTYLEALEGRIEYIKNSSK